MTAELANRTLPVRPNTGVERLGQRTGFRNPDVKEHPLANLPRYRNASLSLALLAGKGKTARFGIAPGPPMLSRPAAADGLQDGGRRTHRLRRQHC
ncbi:MAG: hypothetical protein OXF79_01470 [Chloroflexi bacterium]|nr:hypothetical protein [Chloroflexota bacterium]